jgi:hypothetical protein
MHPPPDPDPIAPDASNRTTSGINRLGLQMMGAFLLGALIKQLLQPHIGDQARIAGVGVFVAVATAALLRRRGVMTAAFLGVLAGGLVVLVALLAARLFAGGR